jgi:hypothetical protein
VLRQREDVLMPFAQRRQSQDQHGEPIEEIVAEPSLAHRRYQVAVGGCDDTHVHRSRLALTDPLDLAFLEDTQQTHLGFRRHVADFVEKKCPAVAGLEPSRTVRDSSSESAFGMPKQFRVKQVTRNRSAVHRRPRLAGAQTGRVHGPREKLFAGPRLAENQHRVRVKRSTAGVTDHGRHRGAAVDEGIEGVGGGQLRFRRLQQRTAPRCDLGQDVESEVERYLDFGQVWVPALIDPALEQRGSGVLRFRQQDPHGGHGAGARAGVNGDLAHACVRDEPAERCIRSLEDAKVIGGVAELGRRISISLPTARCNLSRYTLATSFGQSDNSSAFVLG